MLKLESCLTLSVCLLLAGCSGGKGGPSQPAPSTAASPAPNTPALPEPPKPAPQPPAPTKGDADKGPAPTMIDAHGGAVTSVAWSPDDSLLLTTSTDGAVKLWDAATGKLKKELTGHQGRVNGAVFLPDGSVISVGGEQGKSGEVKHWSGEKWEAKTLKETKKPVQFVAASPDGKWVAWDEFDKASPVILWDMEKGEASPLYGLGATPTKPGGLAFSRDGGLLAGATGYGAVIWSLKSKPPAQGPRLESAQDPTAVAFTADNLLVVPSERHVISVVDPANGKRVENIGGLGEKALGVAVSRDGLLFASGVGPAVRIWDAKTRKPLATLQPPAGKGHIAGCLAFSPDGTKLATGSSAATSGAVFIWDVTAALKR